MNAKKTTRKQRNDEMAALETEVDGCLAELRTIRGNGRWARARRRTLQEQVDALGGQMRRLA